MAIPRCTFLERPAAQALSQVSAAPRAPSPPFSGDRDHSTAYRAAAWCTEVNRRDERTSQVFPRMQYSLGVVWRRGAPDPHVSVCTKSVAARRLTMTDVDRIAVIALFPAVPQNGSAAVLNTAVYLLDHADHITTRVNVECRSDADAVQKAWELISKAPLEHGAAAVWHLDRQVTIVRAGSPGTHRAAPQIGGSAAATSTNNPGFSSFPTPSPSCFRYISPAS
jgi:hypothetical protein